MAGAATFSRLFGRPSIPAAFFSFSEERERERERES